MTLVGDLIRAELSARRPAYIVLLSLFVATSATFGLVLALVNGLESSIGAELSDTLGADARVMGGTPGIAAGTFFDSPSDTATALEARLPGAAATIRLEVEGLLAHGAGFTTGREGTGNVSRAATVLVGIDPVEDARVSPLASYIVKGTDLTGVGEVRAPDGARLVPILLGAEAARANGIAVWNGTFSWDSVLNVTAGRVENSQLVASRAVVVGTYATGFRMVDRGIAYMPRGEVARLIGEHPGDPPANVILLRGGDAGRIDAAAASLGLSSLDAQSFRREYLGPVFDSVRVVAWSIVASLTLMTAGWFAHTLGHHVTADRRKIATLRAVGLPRRVFTHVYVRLAAGLGVAGALVGLVLAVALGRLVAWAVAVSALLGGRSLLPSLSWLEAVALVTLSAVTSAGAALVALRRARNVAIRDALRAP